MNGTFNQVSLIGYVGKDPKTSTLSNGTQRTSLNLATSESWKDQNGQKQEKTDWHLVVGFNGIAKVLADNVRQGDLIHVVGKLETRKYQKDGVDQRVTEVIANDVNFLRQKPGV